MFGKRAQEASPAIHFRSDRVTLINGHYFFTTRENTLEGPFPSRAEAMRESQAYVARVVSYANH